MDAQIKDMNRIKIRDMKNQLGLSMKTMAIQVAQIPIMLNNNTPIQAGRGSVFCILRSGRP